jgi:hypothetical protein
VLILQQLSVSFEVSAKSSARMKASVERMAIRRSQRECVCANS